MLFNTKKPLVHKTRGFMLFGSSGKSIINLVVYLLFT